MVFCNLFPLSMPAFNILIFHLHWNKKLQWDSCIPPFIVRLALKFYDLVVLLQNGSVGAYGTLLSTKGKKACTVIFILWEPGWHTVYMQMLVYDVSSCKINGQLSWVLHDLTRIIKNWQVEGWHQLPQWKSVII